ncbi:MULTISPECIES: DUF4386 domain-containing protein [unclassified Arthrobacter]|uniref:DUF4386 domain-containing protein n=1 Tax=unclassified Arthrobacter TaxID=235627 RepID=UPI002E0C777C|nr:MULTISPECIES: DUF4386 domain-containing protein [unclassified Arthrobacter]MEC5191752.1 hypothetical protein [Arthrobacter sp. MP_M4]MEC5203442.1 hypothetical protein [Arthrobacter sp. MP_M7]
MTSTRKTALVAGIFYLITFVSIPTLTLYGPVKGADFVISSTTNTGALWGGLLEVIVGLAGIGTAVALFPVVKRQNESMALGFVASRTIEAAMIFAGVASILSLVALQQPGVSGAGATSLTTMGSGLVAFYNGTFLLGQSLMPAVNAVLLGTLLYRSRLVPRVLPLLGLIGAPLQFTAVILTMFGLLDRISPVTLVAALPIALWEFSLGLWLVFKGFKPAPITNAMIGTVDVDRPASRTDSH